jgi:hypothetical protein
MKENRHYSSEFLIIPHNFAEEWWTVVMRVREVGDDVGPNLITCSCPAVDTPAANAPVPSATVSFVPAMNPVPALKGKSSGTTAMPIYQIITLH